MENYENQDYISNADYERSDIPSFLADSGDRHDSLSAVRCAGPVAGGFPPLCSVFHFASRSLPSAVALFRALVKRLLLITVTAREIRRSLLSIQLVLESRRGGV
ncbi:hypothetical protein Bca52824_063845 [Brassica carinata]|uniref:Uncharacterized protein n=1 Tax=Brassica carinata TaxID=52824 RepID=A0A8X7QIK3_BRACI|nr:hypothetical protein Bca52824_063845 [Brassica carinata]